MSYPAGKEQICAARDDLKTSLAALTNPSLLLGGTAGIAAAVKQVQTDLDAVAAGIEVAQALMPFGRQGDWLDLFADTVGIVIGVGLWALARRFKPQ